MRKIMKAVLTWMCVTSMLVTAFAHSGRTDSSGGHKDNKNASGLGSYHYHCGGYPAHLHTNGYCPYKDVFPTGVKVSATKTTLGIGEQLAVSATVSPSNACSSDVSWTSSDTSVVKVTNGTIKAVGYGTATITASSFNGKTGSVKITVKEITAEKVSITDNREDSAIYIGERWTLTAAITPENVDDPYSLSGRYDLEIKTDDLSGRDILKILYYLDLQSNGKENEVFPNYDITFLIAQSDICLSGLPAPPNHKIMNTASALLNELYDRSCSGHNLHENYAKETSKALRALLKRGYSDEFAISVLPSFISFLQMRKHMVAKDKQEETFSKSLSAFMHRYFGAINTLASCTMHNERQFIQAPSYNATYFDIPPKLLAFYSAIVYNISKALCEKDEEPYRFIIIPDYREDIYVKPLDVKGSRPVSEHLAVVYLNERYFYEPVTAIQLLAHEIGHYVGSRNREFRAEMIFRSVSTFLLYHTPISQLNMQLDPDGPYVQKSVLAIFADSLSGYFVDKYNADYKSDDGIKWSIASIKKFLQKQKWGILFFEDAIFANELSIIWEKCLKKAVESDSYTKAEFGVGLKMIDGSLNTNFYSENPDSDISFSVFARTIIQYAADLPSILNFQSTDSQSGYAFFEEFMKNILHAYSESLSDLRMGEICHPNFDSGMYRQLLLDTGGEFNVQRSLRHDAVCLALAGEQQWAKCVTPQNCAFDEGKENMIFAPIIISHHIANYLDKCKKPQNPCGIVAESIQIFSDNDTYKQAELIQRIIIDYRNKLCMDCVETHNKFSPDDSLKEKACKTCTNNSCKMNPSSIQLTKSV